MNTITLPRPLVMKLLHLAQAEAGCGLIVRTDGGFTLIPIPDVAGDLPQSVFAFYQTASQTAPDAKHVARWCNHTRTFLGVSARTKGVLELRGWEALDSGLRPLELSLADDREPIQRSGVSRKA